MPMGGRIDNVKPPCTCFRGKRLLSGKFLAYSGSSELLWGLWGSGEAPDAAQVHTQVGLLYSEGLCCEECAPEVFEPSFQARVVSLQHSAGRGGAWTVGRPLFLGPLMWLMSKWEGEA